MRPTLLYKNSIRLIGIVFGMLLGVSATVAQTSSFTYQGRLADGGTAANGNYDLQFALWDSLSGGTQIASTQTLNTVVVSNGVFTVSLDFGANAFTGASRFLEISARPTGGGSFTLLSPRQQITSTPYAVRSLIASSADSVPASGVTAGSANYIQNTVSAQAASNFNISGNGTAGGTLTGAVVNATTQYNLNGTRILASTVTGNTFVGSNAGTANTSGFSNSFFGGSAGAANMTGNDNAFFGRDAGVANTTGGTNAFFGSRVATNNSSGIDNAFFGYHAALFNSTGSANSFFGAAAGASNTAGVQNTAIGFLADVLPGPIFNPTNATAIGARAVVTDSNSLVLGSIKGVNDATADTKVGIGTTAPKQKLHVKGQGVFTADAPTFDPGDGVGPAIRIGFDSNGDYGYINANNTGVAGKNLVLQPNISQGSVGIGTTAPLDRLHVFGDIRMGTSGTNGCLKRNDGTGLVGTCSSDVRFKRDITPFPSLLNKVTQLRPVHYYWRATEFPEKGFGNTQSYGLVAQEVEQVLPDLVSEDEQGYKQVDYSKLPLLLLQAIKELKLENDQLKLIVCADHSRAAICQPAKR